LAGRLRAVLRPLALRDEAFFFAGLRADVFLADFLAALRRTDFFAAFFAVFFADFFAVFFADFFAVFFADFFAAFRAAFFGAFFADFRGSAGRARVGSELLAAALEPFPLRPAPGAARSGALEEAGVGATGGGKGSDRGVSSIHPPLVQPVSISSNPDIGAPCSQRGATRRRFRPPGPCEGVVWI
jgi:hypothetical protein